MRGDDQRELDDAEGPRGASRTDPQSGGPKRIIRRVEDVPIVPRGHFDGEDVFRSSATYLSMSTPSFLEVISYMKGSDV